MPTVFQIRALAGKKRFGFTLVSSNPLVLKAEIPAKAKGNHANYALLSELEKRLLCSVKILAGHKNRKKTISADCGPEMVLQLASLGE